MVSGEAFVSRRCLGRPCLIRGDLVHPDLVRRHERREAACEAGDRRFGRRVDDSIRVAAQRFNRRQVDDAATLSALDHAGKYGLAAQEDRLCVEREQLVPIPLGRVDKMGRGMHVMPDVVDQSVHVSERRHGGRDELADRSRLPDVAWKRDHLTPGAADGFRRLAGQIAVDVVDHDACTVLGQHQSSGATDAASRPGHDRHLPIHKVCRH